MGSSKKRLKSRVSLLGAVVLNKYKAAMKPGTPALHSTRLLDRVRVRIRNLSYSLQTEKFCLRWVRFSTLGELPSAGDTDYPPDDRCNQ